MKRDHLEDDPDGSEGIWIIGKILIPDEAFALRPPLFRYYLHVLTLADTSGRFFCSDRVSASRLGLGERTVFRLRLSLEEKGWLLRKPGYGERRSITYVVTGPRVKPFWTSRLGPCFSAIPREMVYDRSLSAHEFRLAVEFLCHPQWERTNQHLAYDCRVSIRQVQRYRRRFPPVAEKEARDGQSGEAYPLASSS